MTIDEYIQRSQKLIEYAESIMDTEPEKAKALLTEQLQQTIQLINKALPVFES